MTDKSYMPPDFAEAFSDVLQELAEEVAWHHEGQRLMAAGPTVKTVEEGVAAYRRLQN